MRNQRTLRKVVSLNGIALHSGKPAQVRIFPAPPDSGERGGEEMCGRGSTTCGNLSPSFVCM